MDRREFIQKTTRNLILTGLLAFSGYSIIRLIESDEESCKMNTPCSSCGKKSNCETFIKKNDADGKEE